MPNKRITWVDSAKGFGIVLVLILHSVFPEPLRAVASAFAMMLFFWLSGFVFSVRESDSFRSFAVRKIRTLMVPGITCAWIVCCISAAFEVFNNASFDVRMFVCELFGVFVNLRGNPVWNGVTWFLPCLFVVELCAYPCLKICKRGCKSMKALSPKISLVLVSVLLVLGYVYGAYIHRALPWSVDIAVEMAAFFTLGMICRRYTGKCDWSNPVIWSFSFVILMASALANYYYHGGVNPYLTHYGEFILYLIAAISGILMAVGFSQFIQKRFENSLSSRLLNYCGRHSIVFYLVNVSTYAFIPDFLSHIGVNVYDEIARPSMISFVGNGLGPLTDDWFVLAIGGFLTLIIDLAVCVASAEFVDRMCPCILGK